MVRFGAGAAVEVVIEEEAVHAAGALLRVRSTGRAESSAHVAGLADCDAVFGGARHALLVAGAASLGGDSQVEPGLARVALRRAVEAGRTHRVAGQTSGCLQVVFGDARGAGRWRDF